MRSRANRRSTCLCLILGLLLLAGGCTNQTAIPTEAPNVQDRRLDLAIDGETGARILINGGTLSNKTLAKRLRVKIVVDSPTFAGNANNRTVVIGHTPQQADSVGHCTGCEANVVYHDAFGSVPSHLDSLEGVLADGDYTMQLFRDGSTLISSIAIAVNHANFSANNGSFLDEASDQVVTFYLNSNLGQIGQPTVSNQHTRAGTHLGAQIIRPSAADTTIQLGQALSVRGQATSGLPGTTKKFAWDWNASGNNQETFDTQIKS